MSKPRPRRSAGENCTDLGNARRLVEWHGSDLRYVSAWGWLAWDGARWRRDDTGEAERRAKQTARSIYGEAGKEQDDTRRQSLARHALASERAGAITAMLQLARTEPEIAARPDEFDQDSFLLNVANGTIDLRTGKLRPPAREDLITRLAPVAYDAEAACPRWLSHLGKVMAGRADLIDFLQRAVGYSLTGDTREQSLFFLHGTGSNGKGTTIRTLEKLLGDYYRQADFSSFLERRSDAVREDLADLVGARLVVASETSDSRKLAEGLVKTLTGQDTVSVRFLHRDRFTYRPNFKLWLVANSKPPIKGTDEGIWRRILLVPFDVIISRAEWDENLDAALQGEELPGILAWAAQGAQLWLEDGLRVPDAVRAATQSYREENDTLGAFLRDCCVLESDASELAGALHRAYNTWAHEEGEHELSSTALGRKLTARGLSPHKSNGVAYRLGLRLSTGVPVSTSVPGNASRNAHSAQIALEPVQTGTNGSSELPVSPSGPASEGGKTQLRDGWSSGGEKVRKDRTGTAFSDLMSGRGAKP